MGDIGNQSRFRVERLTPTDSSLMLRPCNRRGGDLTKALIAPLCWPVAADETDTDTDTDTDARTDFEALQRLKCSVQLERRRLERDPTAHGIKAVADDTGEIVSIARWNFFPRGYSYDVHEYVDVGECVPADVLKEDGGPYDLALFRAMWESIMTKRMEWMQPRFPCWVLMDMVTWKSYRGQGAASMLVNWGIERAREDGIPAYLEAPASGKRVYERFGFRQVGETVPWDCRPYGKDVVFETAQMAYFPEADDSISRVR